MMVLMMLLHMWSFGNRKLHSWQKYVLPVRIMFLFCMKLLLLLIINSHILSYDVCWKEEEKRFP
jgi:hypothetical protein